MRIIIKPINLIYDFDLKDPKMDAERLFKNLNSILRDVEKEKRNKLLHEYFTNAISKYEKEEMYEVCNMMKICRDKLDINLINEPK